MICSDCNKNPAIIFYEKIDNGKNTMEGLCFDCALIKYVEDTGNNSYADQEEDYDNSGCVTCGNLAFPDCMDSCPMFDY